MLLFGVLTLNKVFVNKYATSFFLDYTQPFYIVFGIALFLDLYPELFFMNAVREMGYDIEVNQHNWIAVGTQLGLIIGAFLVTYVLRKNKDKNDEDKIEDRKDGLGKMSMFESFSDDSYNRDGTSVKNSSDGSNDNDNGN